MKTLFVLASVLALAFSTPSFAHGVGGGGGGHGGGGFHGGGGHAFVGHGGGYRSGRGYGYGGGLYVTPCYLPGTFVVIPCAE
jgi:hypothetical protein